MEPQIQFTDAQYIDVDHNFNGGFDLNSEPYGEEDDTWDLSLEPHIEEEHDNHSEEELDTNVGDTNMKRHILTNVELKAIYDMLLQKSNNGKLKKNVTTVVASTFSVSIRTVQRIWKRGQESSSHDVSSRRVSNCGRKKLKVNLNQLRELSASERTTIRSLANSMNISISKAFSLFKEGTIRRHSNAIKPYLKDANKISRLQFCLSMLEESSLTSNPRFKGMYNTIHIDEKWFYLTKQSENYYLLPDEDPPLRVCKSKNFIVKVMFIAAIARPRFDAQGNEVFSGKIGIFPFVRKEPAKRSSVNRVAGTLETKPITSVNRNIVRSFMIEKILPAIKEKWPRDDTMHTIFIQQDNAKTHIDPKDIAFCEAASKDGFDIRIICQPANSPDLNILDLGFFRAIQSLQEKEPSKTVDELVDAVVKSFDNYPTVMSNRIFLTLQSCMIEIMKARGSQKYDIPHMYKARLEREGNLPVQLDCDAALVQDVREFLN